MQERRGRSYRLKPLDWLTAAIVGGGLLLVLMVFFLTDGMICQVMLHEGTPLSIEMPPSVVVQVVEADPVVRGQTASSSYKPGRLANGRRVMIPPHVEAGTRIVVNTADGSYVERAKD